MVALLGDFVGGARAAGVAGECQEVFGAPGSWEVVRVIRVVAG